MTPIDPGQIPATPAASLPGTVPPHQEARIKKAAQDFEAMALGQMLAPMFKTVDTSKGAFGGGSGEEAWQPMMVTELGKSVARAGGVGLARPVMDQMLRMQEAGNETPGSAPAVRNPAEHTQVEQMLLERPPLRRTTSQQVPQRPGV